MNTSEITKRDIFLFVTNRLDEATQKRIRRECVWNPDVRRLLYGIASRSKADEILELAQREFLDGLTVHGKEFLERLTEQEKLIRESYRKDPNSTDDFLIKNDAETVEVALPLESATQDNSPV